MNSESSRKAAANGGHTLVICEKPDAARRVAEARSSGLPEILKVGNVIAFRVRGFTGKTWVICAAMGHLYGASDTSRDRRVYPALDLEWFPIAEKERKAGRSLSSRIRAIRRLSENADEFVNACDFDIEGETIGHNVLRYACK